MSDLTSPPHSPAPGPRAPTLQSAWGHRAFKLIVVAAGVALGVACVALALFERGFEHCRDDGRCVQVTFARGFPWVASAQAVTGAVANGPLVELDHGRPRTLGVYVAGRPEGCFFHWDDTGALDRFGRFHEGRKEGTWIVRSRVSADAPPAYEERIYRDDVELTSVDLSQRADVPFDPCTPPGGDGWRASLTRVSPERGPLQVRGALTRADVKLVVDERIGDLGACRRHVPFPALIDVTIDAEGRAQSESASCVRAAISGWRFPRASGATTVRLDATLVPPAARPIGTDDGARIEVRASEEVTIFLDGKQVARGRAASLPVSPGEHKLRYERHAIGIDEERIVRVGPGEIADVDAYLAPIR